MTLAQFGPPEQYRPRLGNAAKRVYNETPGPWKAWKGTRHARAIRFIETYCRAPTGKGHGKPMKLARFQKEWLEEILAEGVGSAVKTTPRGNGKSTEGGAFGVWAAFDDDDTGSPQVPIVATTVGQAIRSCYGVAVAMIKAEPELANRCVIYTGIATPRVIVHANGGELFPIANEPDGLQGLNPSVAIVDEIGFQPMESWGSLLMASGKRERSLVMGLGTRGLDKTNALFQISKLVHEGAKIPGFRFREYAAPDGCRTDDRAAWRIGNPALRAGFLRKEALETDLRLMPEGHFRLFRLNQQVDGTDSWLGPDGGTIWEGLADPWPFVPKAKTFVGVDVGIKHDSTAVVAVQRRPDGNWQAKCKLWVPSADRPVDVTDVMQHIRDLAKDYEVKSVSFDPRFFDVPAKMLSDERISMLEIPQTPERMTPIVGKLFEAIKGGTLRHDGDPAFSTQVLNGVPRFSENGFTLQKGKSRGRIDAAIALGLAMDRATWAAVTPDRRPRIAVGF